MGYVVTLQLIHFRTFWLRCPSAGRTLYRQDCTEKLTQKSNSESTHDTADSGCFIRAACTVGSNNNVLFVVGRAVARLEAAVAENEAYLKRLRAGEITGKVINGVEMGCNTPDEWNQGVRYQLDGFGVVRGRGDRKHAEGESESDSESGEEEDDEVDMDNELHDVSDGDADGSILGFSDSSSATESGGDEG